MVGDHYLRRRPRLCLRRLVVKTSRVSSSGFCPTLRFRSLLPLLSLVLRCPALAVSGSSPHLGSRRRRRLSSTLNSRSSNSTSSIHWLCPHYYELHWFFHHDREPMVHKSNRYPPACSIYLSRSLYWSSFRNKSSFRN